LPKSSTPSFTPKHVGNCYRLTACFRHYSKEVIGVVMGINNLLEVFNEKYARKIAVNFGVLLTAQYLHQIVNLASDGGPTRFKVLLHAQARKESQDHTR
jgi:hypothetical protein